MQTLRNFIDLLSLTLQFLIFLRAAMSWFNPNPQTGLGRWIADVVDPLIWPFQRILPPMAGLDFSPFLAIVTIGIIQRFLLNLL